jgi:uncharacterized protein
MSDELSAPLGKKKTKRKLPRFKFEPGRWPVARMLAGLVVLILLVPIVRVMLVNEPSGGRPAVEVPISSQINTNPVASEVSVPLQAQPGGISVEDPNASPQANGLEADLAENNGPQITRIDDNLLVPALPVAHVADDTGIIADLGEQTQYGVIPRISAGGQTPFAAYARPSIGPEAAAGRSMIAIVVTGLGLSQSGTLSAIAELPDDVTLAFAPYGRTLDATVSVARTKGHELMLEVPMEPFDYPNSDPGPNTLLTNQPARKNLDNLNWVMARFGGYVGLINYQGARFTASAADLGPIMEELGTRGIGFLDDGSSNRSLTRQLALANGVPYGRASVQLDTNPSRAAILEALRKLEQTAADEGGAIGIISALPVSISTIKSWAAGLEDRQIVLVPASVLMKANP